MSLRVQAFVAGSNKMVDDGIPRHRSRLDATIFPSGIHTATTPVPRAMGKAEVNRHVPVIWSYSSAVELDVHVSVEPPPTTRTRPSCNNTAAWPARATCML
jgi:hypothetical protein